MRYSVGMILIGTLLLIPSFFGENIQIQGLSFHFNELFLNISATFFALAILTGAYKLFGEEQTVILLKQIAAAQNISQKLINMGIVDIESSRRRFDVKKIEKELFNSREIFVVSQNFSAIKYVRLQNYLIKYLEKTNTSLKIIIGSTSRAKKDILIFRNNLPAKLKNRCFIKQVDKITCGMYGGDDVVYVTLYVTHLTGDESPALCARSDGKASLYYVYRHEFELLWEKGESL